MKRPAAAKSLAKKAAKAKPLAKKKPWNSGKKHNVSSAQHVFVQRQDVDLWLAATLFVAGPIHAVVLYLGLVTGRRISEILRLRGGDINLGAGEHLDFPHIVFQSRDEDHEAAGMGKLPCGLAVARLSAEAVQSIESVLETGVSWECKPVLEAYRANNSVAFEKVKPLSADKFKPGPLKDDALWFPASGASCKQKWRTRQSVWHAVKVTRAFMFEITKKRCFNPSEKFNGAHVHVHGATRHTNAALLMANPASSEPAPSEPVILELQQRSDYRTFRKHYAHANEDELQSALKFAHVGSPFGTPTRKQELHHAKPLPEPVSAAVIPEIMAPSTSLLQASSHEAAASSEQKEERKEKEEVLSKPKQSRNAWRQKKRRQGRAKHQSSARQGKDL